MYKFHECYWIAVIACSHCTDVYKYGACRTASLRLTSSRSAMKPSRMRQKKSKTAVADDIVFTLSDLEENRFPMKVTVEEISKDRRRVLRKTTDVAVHTESETPHTETDLCNEFLDLANIDIAAVTAEISKANRRTAGRESTKKRYVSSVGFSLASHSGTVHRLTAGDLRINRSGTGYHIETNFSTRCCAWRGRLWIVWGVV